MSIYVIYFSPTKGTEKIAKWIANEFGAYQEIDLSSKDTKLSFTFHKEDTCIIAVPSYGGRVPAIALERMSCFEGNQAKAVLVVSYGNRAYEDTFKELQDYLVEKDFHCIAGIAAVSEHSIMPQFATGRANELDQRQLIGFAKQIMDKINCLQENEHLKLPGNYPYRGYHEVPLKPKANKQCSQCGLCASLCPIGAIPESDPTITNHDICITCMRCVSICPKQARRVNQMKVKLAATSMKKNCSKNKENELFL